MLKEKIIIIDFSKKNKLVSEEVYYEKIKMVGQGTFGKVYLQTKSKKDGKEWALKEVLQDRRYKNRQLGIIARIEHCNIIEMKQYFLKVIKDECYLSMIMEYIPSSLNIMIKNQRKFKKPFAPQIRKLLIFQLFKALYYMNLTKICHRDLKPPNILVNDETYELKICDFGSAKIFDKRQCNVSYICSRYYRAPELVLLSTDYDTYIDVWSSGCIIVELLTLEPIFPGDSSQEQLIEIIKILGSPPQKYLSLYQSQKAIHYNLPNIKPSSWEAILHKYEPQAQLIDLISKMLTYDTQARISPFEGLKHPYFQDLPTYQKYVQKIPHLFYFGDLQSQTNGKQIEELEKLYSLPKPEPEFFQKHKSLSIQSITKNETTPNTCSQQNFLTVLTKQY